MSSFYYYRYPTSDHFYKFYFLLITLFSCTAAFGQTERITSFDSQIRIDTSGDVYITETIKVISNGEEIKRGIYRSLPLTRVIADQPTQRIKYDIIKVSKDGQESPYHTEKNGGFLMIYIGAEDVFLDPGNYTYEIAYKSARQIGFFEKYDEIYWNATGTQWIFPIDSVTATVELPAGVRLFQNACYTGPVGSTESNCTFSTSGQSNLKWTASGLGPEEGLTIAAGFSKGFIAPPPKPGFLQKNSVLFLSLAGILGLFIYYYNNWRKYGIDPSRPTIYPQFNVPGDLSPASMGYIWKERMDNKFISSAIINLAVKGYLEIKEVETNQFLGLFKKKNYALVKKKAVDQNLPSEELKLMHNIFSGTEELLLDGKYDPSIAQMVRNFESEVTSQNDALVSKGNNNKLLIKPALILILGSLILSLLDWLLIEREGPIILIVFFAFVFLVIFFFLGRYLVNRFPLVKWIFGIIYVGMMILMYYIYSYDKEKEFHLNIYLIFGFIITGFFVTLIYQFLIRRPSEEKLNMQSLIEGFKMYMGAAEKNQLQHFNPPKMTPEIFEKLLPFAIILGVDEIWGEKFKSLLESMSIEPSSYHSGWYSGSYISPSAFGDSLNSSISSTMSSASTPPSSSGSGGGGSSGGGGGGGGGGGW